MGDFFFAGFNAAKTDPKWIKAEIDPLKPAAVNFFARRKNVVDKNRHALFSISKIMPSKGGFGV